MIESKIISSLEKCYHDQKVADFAELKSLSALKNERISFQLIFRSEDELHKCIWALPKAEGTLAKFVTFRNVVSVPCMYPIYEDRYDDNYLRTEPGLVPDILMPLENAGRTPIVRGELKSLWVTVELNGSVKFGEHPLTISLLGGDDAVLVEKTINIKIISASLPKQEIKVTRWFHGDCIAQYYDCAVFSRKWWSTVDKFIKTYVRGGGNMILTPIFTPALDTNVGAERLTVQLVDVTLENGKYSFGYKNLDRWLNLCRKNGIKYYEIAHFFTQWGAGHAPKIMATVDGEYKRIFGWETDASGEEYSTFLKTFIPDFLSHMKERGEDQLCHFHISDEPGADHLEQYTKSKNVVSDLLKDYTVMDALSNIEFYNSGVVTTPIPATNHIEPFIEAGVKPLWAYYCCGQVVGVSNQFLAMPSWRNRSIGYQLFKYDVEGFLHWGYNFYNTQRSISATNPFYDTCGSYFAPAGDAFVVYPAPHGETYESLRFVVFHEALQDLAAFKLCAEKLGKDRVIAELESVLGEIKFDRCVTNAEDLLVAREKINELLDKAFPYMSKKKGK